MDIVHNNHIHAISIHASYWAQIAARMRDCGRDMWLLGLERFKLLLPSERLGSHMCLLRKKSYLTYLMGQILCFMA